jgi:hypothetical protein
MADIKLSATFPGESALVAVLNYLAVHRSTMSEENRNRADDLWLKAFERLERAIDNLEKR